MPIVHTVCDAGIDGVRDESAVGVASVAAAVAGAAAPVAAVAAVAVVGLAAGMLGAPDESPEAEGPASAGVPTAAAKVKAPVARNASAIEHHARRLERVCGALAWPSVEFIGTSSARAGLLTGRPRRPVR